MIYLFCLQGQPGYPGIEGIQGDIGVPGVQVSINIVV